jgi:hypothetical protein
MTHRPKQAVALSTQQPDKVMRWASSTRMPPCAMQEAARRRSSATDMCARSLTRLLLAKGQVRLERQRGNSGAPRLRLPRQLCPSSRGARLQVGSALLACSACRRHCPRCPITHSLARVPSKRSHGRSTPANSSHTVEGSRLAGKLAGLSDVSHRCLTSALPPISRQPSVRPIPPASRTAVEILVLLYQARLTCPSSLAVIARGALR